MENGNDEMELELGKKYGKSYDENANSERCGWFSTKMFKLHWKEIWMEIYDVLVWCAFMHIDHACICNDLRFPIHYFVNYVWIFLLSCS